MAGCTHTDTHTHSGWDNLDTPIHLIYTSLGCERKQETPEESHEEMGKTCKPHTDSGPGWESIIFASST